MIHIVSQDFKDDVFLCALIRCSKTRGIFEKTLLPFFNTGHKGLADQIQSLHVILTVHVLSARFLPVKALPEHRGDAGSLSDTPGFQGCGILHSVRDACATRSRSPGQAARPTARTLYTLRNNAHRVSGLIPGRSPAPPSPG